MILNSKYGDIKIFTDNIEQQALSQVIELGNSVLGENANIRVMPDCHSGKGCVIGTTMKITDKICPNLVGVDIGCSVTLIKTDIDFASDLPKLDKIIRNNIPSGTNVYSNSDTTANHIISKLKCYNQIPQNIIDRACKSLGTLGGGNHFIEAYKDGYLAVHTGSRNIGKWVAEYYQSIARNILKTPLDLSNIAKAGREKAKEIHRNNKIPEYLAYLTGSDMQNYLHDIRVLQDFAKHNGIRILSKISSRFSGGILSDDVCIIHSMHNYIDTNNMILRKGAISAQKDELLVIPLNMRDGLLICKGKGNADWNCSAPHGAGRLYSRSKAKEIFTLEEYRKSMNGIYSTCINDSTIDESPFAYKDFNEIIQYIEPTVDIIDRLIPIYNFKSN